jgi:hypothetical protein
VKKRFPRGQAMTEYAGISTILIFGAIAAGVVTPVGKLFVQALQQYVDLMFFALNIGLG